MSAKTIKIAATILGGAALLIALLRLLPGPGETLLPSKDRARTTSLQLIDPERAEENQDITADYIRPGLDKSLRDSPLISEPLLAYAFIAGDEGNGALDEALRRNPRVLSARLLRAQRFLEAEQYDATVHELTTLISVDRNRVKEYLAALVEVAGFEEGREAILKQLDKHPHWAHRLVTGLNVESTDLQFLYEANKRVPEAQTSFMKRLIQEGRLDLALIAWIEFADADLTQLSWPYNPRFEENAAPPPFNWYLPSNSTGEYLNNGGLYIVHSARRELVFAEQYMALGPGIYELDVLSEGQLISGAGEISVVVNCAGQKDILAEHSITRDPVTSQQQPTTMVPIPAANCGFQRIAIIGKLGQSPRFSRMEIREVTITPALPRANGEG